MDRSTLRRTAARIGPLRSLNRRVRTPEQVTWDVTESLEDVVVTPFTDLLDRWQGREAHRGGPSWPDWDRRTAARHGQRGRPIDTRPAEPEDVLASLEAAAWGGPLVRHYGHQIADFSTRLLAAARAYPDLDVLFATKPGFGWQAIADAPPWMRAILDWFGIDVARCRIVDEPICVRALVVAPQAEQVGGPGPDETYLDALLENTERQLGGLPSVTDTVVYVSRAGMSSRFAGEAYLEEVLIGAGVQVLRPEAVSLPEQLRTYHAARRLIFAEGSALHTLQLTGRLAADVAVLERRAERRLAEENLKPRVTSLTYEGCLAEQIHGTLPTGAPARAQGISVLDEELLLGSLDRLGVTVADRWDRRRYETARDADVSEWLASDSASSRGPVVRSSPERSTVAPPAPRARTPAPRPSGACLAALAREPLPLYSDGLDIALLWNAKAACTFAIKWFFFQDGVLDEAEVYAPWPHQYRQQVYCARPDYKDGIAAIPRLGPRAIKLVRDPFDRVVSSYLSYCTQAHRPAETSLSGSVASSARRLREGMLIGPATSSQHVPMLKAIGRHLRRKVGDGNLFTFREWVGFLESLDLEEADIHVRRQLHPCERDGSLPELTVVRAEEAEEELPRLEEALGLRPSQYARLRRSRHHTERVDDARFVADERLGGAIGVSIPTTRWFYDVALIETVGRLYREDIDAYGYPAPEPTA